MNNFHDQFFAFHLYMKIVHERKSHMQFIVIIIIIFLLGVGDRSVMTQFSKMESVEVRVSKCCIISVAFALKVLLLRFAPLLSHQAH